MKLITHLNGFQKVTYDNLDSSKLGKKKCYDRKFNEQGFKLGDFIFLLSGLEPKKLEEQYFGP